EFEARFTAINQSFYKNLKDTYPSLSQTDLKLCALVKLNFSSKEMSSLLGISIESVHTSRYRLRKKLNLERNDNLTEFIANF
ncbi:MAG: helix-turn-helix transcriptional regulator, partial [Cellulophaga baltica]